MPEPKDFLLEQEKLEEVSKALIEPIGSTIGTNIQKTATAEYQKIICHSIGEAIEYESMEYVLSTGKMEGAISGPFYVLFPTGEALNVAGTMMMMTGDELLNFTSKGYDAEAEDAFKEVMSQITGQVSTVLRNMFKEANGSIASTKNINLIEDLKELDAEVEGEELVWLQYKMTFQDEEPFIFYYVLSKELAFSMAPMEGAEDAAVNKGEAGTLEGDGLSQSEVENNIDAIKKIKVPLVVTLASKQITVEDVLKQISVGSIIEFNVPFDSYLDLNVGNRKIGEGEVVTVNEFYGLQIKSVLSPKETLESLL